MQLLFFSGKCTLTLLGMQLFVYIFQLFVDMFLDSVVVIKNLVDFLLRIFVLSLKSSLILR